jgi:Cu/Ag efflux pump CusA
MIRGIIRSSIQFRFLVVVIAVALIAFGANQLRAMPVDVLPEYSPPFVEIQTEALGLSAADVEHLITVPMEQDLLAGVAWIDTITSKSVPGLSSVLLFFEPGTDLFQARQMVSERMAQAAVGIPHVSKPPTMIQPQSSTSRFMIVGLSSEEVPLIEMSVLARWVIGPRLLGVPGCLTASGATATALGAGRSGKTAGGVSLGRYETTEPPGVSPNLPGHRRREPEVLSI